MADLNVFQLTNQELHKESNTPKKSVKESVKRIRRTKPFNIPLNKVKLESLSRFLEADEDNATELTVDYTPEDDVVLVIDPEMEEVPEDTEEAVEAAEELVGDHVCKCSICGANYVTDKDITEEFELEDEQCPVCGEVGEQVVVGVITPLEELSDEDKEDIDNVDSEEDVDIDVEADADGDDEIDMDVEDDVETDSVEYEDDDFEESVMASRRKTLKRRSESVRRPMRRVSRKPVSEDYSFDEVTFNRMLTRFAKENYSNVKFVKITKGSVKGNKLTLEGIVTTTKGSKRPIKFVSENFDPSTRMTLKFREFGPFTESVANKGVTFIVECRKTAGFIKPITLKYSYKTKDASMKESNSVYSVTGKVLSESVQRRSRNIR